MDPPYVLLCFFARSENSLGTSNACFSHQESLWSPVLDRHSSAFHSPRNSAVENRQLISKVSLSSLTVSVAVAFSRRIGVALGSC